MLMFLQGYHGLLSQSMTTERMYGKILTVCSLIHYAYIMHYKGTAMLISFLFLCTNLIVRCVISYVHAVKGV